MSSVSTGRALVHIGYHKTATTWFQQRLFPLVENAYLVPRQAAIDAFLEPGAFQFDPVQARRLIGAGRGERPILSLESLSGYLHNAGLAGSLSKDMAYRLRDTLPDADIVVLIRRQPEVLVASYAQYVSAGGTHSIRRYLWPERFSSLKHQRRDRFPRFSLDHFDYLPLLRHYRKVFGAERVHVFLYEAFKADREGFVREFCERFGLTCREPPATGRQQNPSYPPWVLALARHLNFFTAGRVVDKFHLLHVPGWFQATRELCRWLTRTFPGQRGADRPERLLGAADLQCIGDRYAESNQRLAEEFGLPLAAYGYPLPSSQAAPVVPAPAAPVDAHG